MKRIKVKREQKHTLAPKLVPAPTATEIREIETLQARSGAVLDMRDADIFLSPEQDRAIEEGLVERAAAELRRNMDDRLMASFTVAAGVPQLTEQTEQWVGGDQIGTLHDGTPIRTTRVRIPRIPREED